ncbi:endospore germination permease [Paenibacillus sp. MWE-103]|uniref:Endospore germination permease n=1 Tax=Paenibacillus artemisiicola TaxID=1172618 RepID=A0ABS3WFU2_9BACL|nr:endospore germination permease [Paenibacillus artemisiicola]MBO7746981.1 endospore germination permease [Paenibacillus artemisiicola]
MKTGERIGGKQLFCVIAVMQSGMNVLLTINPAIAAARQDAWLSELLAGAVGLFMVFVHARLSLLFPGMTFVEYVVKIVGKWAGNALIGFYMLFWYVVLAMILRQYTEFILSTILPRTPMLVPLLGLLLAAVYVTVAGIEVLARCAELFGPFILLGIFLPLLLSISDMKINNLLPVFADTGMLKIVQGSLPTMTFLGDCVIMCMLYKFVERPERGSRFVLLGVAVSSFLTCVSTFLVIAVLGQAQGAGITYPYFNLIRNTSYFDFVQNLDSLVIAIWIVSVFIKVSLYLFVCAHGTAQWFGVRRWRRMLWFTAPAVLAISLVPRDFVESSVIFPQRIAIPYILPYHMFGIPLILWAIAKIRGAGRAAPGKN